VLSLDEAFFASCAHLDLVVISSTGYDKVDLQAAKRHGVKVANTPDFSSNSVAEMNLALIFALGRKLQMLDRRFRENPAKPDCDPFEPEMLPLFGMEIAGKTLGTHHKTLILQSLSICPSCSGRAILWQSIRP